MMTDSVPASARRSLDSPEISAYDGDVNPAVFRACQAIADHNDPNAVNSIFSDIEVSAADVYDLLGFPSGDPAKEESVVIALTFAPLFQEPEHSRQRLEQRGLEHPVAAGLRDFHP
ncbi:MAG: hypothetical protein QOH92_181 [Chloroflexota bacterium]|jgi:hypothetical protein|nr:hypothetical protein [Chloroflexota bacterium]